MTKSYIISQCVLATITAITLILGVSTAIDNDPKHQTPSAVVDEDYLNNGVFSEAKVELGRMLFFDKILSGNQNISCATCHHPSFATADGVALPLGEGPSGLGPDRKIGETEAEIIHERVPRNSPALFNLGAREFGRMFHDGRVEVDSFGYYDGGFITPAKWKLPTGLENVLAAQAMFPVSSPAEMAGQRGENGLAEATALNNLAGPGGLWEQVSERLQAIPAYVELFEEAFPEDVQKVEDVSMVLAANAISAFQSSEFRADQSAFDTYLRTGEGLSENAVAGMQLFYGKAQCSTCHSGKFQTDHNFYSIAMPQIGPGKNHGSDQSYWRATGQSALVEDFGRGRVTYRPEDAYKFRTPSLRNVEHTGPYGHDGAYSSLEEVVRHHLNPVDALMAYELPEGLLQPVDRVLELRADGPKFDHYEMSESRRSGFLERDSWVQRNDELKTRIAEANELAPIALQDMEVDQLLEFLKSLTDPKSIELNHLIPDEVPSGLPVDQAPDQ